MVTGFIDDESSEKIKGLWKLGAAPAVDTQCAHIFSESTNAGMEDERKVRMLLCLPCLPLVYSSLRRRMRRTPGR